jgi:tetratricopeptide (TPR) repeat protein
MGYPYEQEHAISMSGEALAMARRLGDDNVLTGALLARHVTLTDVHHLPERLALMEELASVGGEHRELAAEEHHWRLYDLFELGDLEAAERELTKLEALAAELRQPVLQSLAAHWRGNWAELTGDVELAARCAEEGLRHGRRAHMHNAVSDWAAKLFSARRREDRVNEIMPLVERLATGAGRGTSWPSGLALLQLEAGDEAAARATYERELAEGPEAVPHGMYRLTTLALLSELCTKLGDVDRAEALYAALLPYAHRNVIVAYTFFLGPVDSYLAYLADARGDRRLASRHLSSALARTRAMGAPLLTAELEERNRELAVT